MARQFRTEYFLPQMGNRRYGVLELGTQNVEIIREEHRVLLHACGKLLGIEPEKLTFEDIEALAQRKLEPLPEPEAVASPPQ